MNHLDIINSGFQLLGSIAAWANFYKLYKDKIIKGIYWPVFILYSLWGLWNLVYFYGLGHWYSFSMGLILATGNLAWLVEMFVLNREKAKLKLLDLWSKVV